MADQSVNFDNDADLARLIIQSATDFAIISSDPEGILTSWNSGAEKLLGWEAGEVVGRRVDLFFTPEDRAAGRPKEEMALARAEGFASDERWHIRKDGSRFWASGELQPIRSAACGSQDITGYLKIIRDRTDHRLLIDQLEEARQSAAAAASKLLGETERLRALFEDAPGFMAIFRGGDLILELANASYRRLVGPRDLIGKPVREALPEVEGQGYFELLDEVLATGKPVTGHTMPVMLASAPGEAATQRFVDYVFQPIRDSSGSVTGVFLEGFDVTDAVRARNESATAAAFQMAVLDQLGEGVIVTDASGQIRFINDAATHLHGVAKLDVAPDEYSDTYHLLTEAGEPHPTADLPLSRAVHGTAVRDARWRIRRPDGSDVLAIGNAQPVIVEGLQVGAVLTVRDDTARRTAEEALAANEERFRELADNIPTFCWSAHADGSIYWYNRRWYDYTGTTPASQEGWGWETVHHPDYLALVVAEWKRAIAEGNEFEMTFPLRSGDGEYRRFLTRVVPIRDKTGKVLRWFGTNTDVEQQKSAEEALDANRSYLKLLLDSADEAFYATDREGVTKLCNAAFLRLTGFEDEKEAVGRKLHDLIHHSHPDGSPYLKETCPIYQCAAHGVAAHVTDELFFRIDGTPFPVEYRASPILEDGQPNGAICTFNDVTERRAAEAALMESELRFERIADSTPVVMWVTSLDRTRSFVNRAYVDFLGITYEEAVQFDWRQIIHPDDADQILAASIAGEASLQPFILEGRYRGSGEEYRWLRSISQPRFDDQGSLTGFIGVAHDITFAKEAEVALREMNATLEMRIEHALVEREKIEEQLRQSQKMEAVGQLTGGIAHDFNNLLTGVIGSLDMMQRRIAKGETDKIERYATTAMTAANRAAALTHRLLAFARRQPLDPKPVNANRLVTGMEELLRRTIGESVQLEIVTAGGLWQTLCDPNQLESAILNLAINARDAMPEGGQLTIESCNAHLDNAYAAKQRDVIAGQYICICVTDTGTGMTQDTIKKAFEPFFTTKPTGQGTGLGLSMIYGFTRQSEGYARIYSEVGKGTTIKLYLPRYHGEAKDAEESDGEVTVAHRAEAGEVVLVVEDETAVRDLVVEVLEELGYRAIEAVDGPSGLKLLHSNMRIDLLVTDIGLPGLNGRQVADAAREHRPDLKVLFMTGYAENATIANGFLEPGMQMITKPFAIEALVTRIRDMIEEQ